MTLQELYNLDESSGYSFEGSFTPDLVFSKLWLIKELANITPKISVIYVLGSWYGNLALILQRYGQPKVGKIINVETNKHFLSVAQNMLAQAGVDNVEYMLKDANQLNYQQLDREGAVINTSLTDMPGLSWFEHIPSGTLVALQARDHDPGQQYTSAEDIQRKFPLSQVIYSGSLNLQDPETDYQRFMVIGIK